MRSLSVSIALLSASLLLACPAFAQTATQPAAPAPQPPPLVGALAAHPDWPQANPADVQSIDALMSALYDVISGPAGQPRNWDRFRSLFLPTGRLGVIRAASPATETHPAREDDVVFLAPDDYVQRDDPYFRTHGFFEHSLANRVEQFGSLISVWSTYESRHNAADPAPFARGINSLQIVHIHGRYWIASILWDEERPGLTLPEKYLH